MPAVPPALPDPMDHAINATLEHVIDERLVEAVRAVPSMSVAHSHRFTPLPTDQTWDLSAPAQALRPLLTPLVNMLPRVAGLDVDTVHWKAIMGFTREEPSFILASTDSTCLVAPHFPAADAARDPSGGPEDRARLLAMYLYQLKHLEERHIIQAILAQASESADRSSRVRAPTSPDKALQPADVDALLDAVYAATGAAPDYVVLSHRQQHALTQRVLEQNTSHAAHIGPPPAPGTLTCNYRVIQWLHRETGALVPLIIDRFCPDDTVFTLPMTWPTYAATTTATGQRIPLDLPDHPIEVVVNREYLALQSAEDAPLSERLTVYVDEAIRVNYLGGVAVLRGLAVPDRLETAPRRP